MRRDRKSVDSISRGKRKSAQAIDEVLETLYAIDVQGYHLPASILKEEAVNRIHRTLERLSREKRQQVEDQANYRLERFEKFRSLPERKREEIIRLAKERHITIEEAYVMATEENV